MTNRSVIRSRQVMLPTGTQPADVVIEAGVIRSVTRLGTDHGDVTVHDFGDRVILPGLVDTHVHLNEPGRTEWEGFETGTKAARAGGVTTVVDMPLNSSPVTTSKEALDQKRAAAKGRIHVDVGFHAGLVPGNALEVDRVIRAGARAAKAFLCHSGIDEFPNASESDLSLAMPQLGQCGATLMVHAELVHEVPAISKPESYADYLATRPARFERNAIDLMIRLSKQTGCPVHIVHLADAACLPVIRKARDEGVRLTVETCPHYLYFDAERIEDGRTDFKCAPPIRDAENRDGLWSGLRDGLIDLIVSDHSPCPPELKCLESGRFDQAWGGISSLQLGLPVIWTEASRRGMELADVIRWMSAGPANLLGLEHGIEPGKPAHLVVFDPDRSWTVDQRLLHHRHPVTPYHGEVLRGVVEQTFVHGDCESFFNGRLV